MISIWIFISTLITIVLGSEDRFNYRSTDGNDYGPQDWSNVACDVPGECPGWPDGWELGVGWQLGTNKCKWCPAGTNHACGLHRQSPIDLLRGDATTGHDTECYDYHWMAYEDRTCTWDNIINNPNTTDPNNFRIRRHALQILQPVNDNGELQCRRRDGRNAFPRLDYSKGFPNWWYLSHTEVTVPSEHFQEGKQYDAEVHLAHFYEIEHERKMGKVAIFLESNPNRDPWPFLDKLICQWREVEEKTREECGLASVPPYPGCRNPTRQENGASPTMPPSTLAPVSTPTIPPSQSPIASSQSPIVPSQSPVVPSQSPMVVPSGSVVCSDYANHPTINMKRICNGCCRNPRSSTTYCHSVYNFFPSNIDEVCSSCCNPSKVVGPPGATHPIYPQIDCTQINNPFRMCKPNSCCERGPSSSSYCSGVFNTYGGDMSSICWYCCSEPIDINADVQLARSASSSSPILMLSDTEPAAASAATIQGTSNPATSSSFEGMTCAELGQINGINIDRICRDGGCCDSVRSSTDRCNYAYEFFGDFMSLVCSGCCNPSKTIAPPPPPHPIYPSIRCTLVDNPSRICKPNSCCEPTKSNSAYCQSVYEIYGDSMGSICWYCCSDPKEVDPVVVSSARQLQREGEYEYIPNQIADLPTSRNARLRSDVFLPHGFYSGDLRMDPSDFKVNNNLEEEYIARIHEYHDLQNVEELHAGQDRRRLTGDNYASVAYSPYQWMREVKTEYYFRYEGGQMVPPCFETVHYRVMKDPILINPVQLAELERLLAWRIAPRGSGSLECMNDSAGRPRAGSNGNAVDLNRPLQEYSNIHRKVFCECNDWVSKFQEDKDWCLLNENQRWYQEPYNFDSGGSF